MKKDVRTPRSAKSEIKIYGVNACLAVWQNRSRDIIRVYVTKERLGDFGPLLRWCAQEKKAYHVLEAPEVEKVAASVHHEGVVLLVQERPYLNDQEMLDKLVKVSQPAPAIFLDGVKNPHNIGSILRVAAHFGAASVMGSQKDLPRLTGAALRVAEGGAECVDLAALAQTEATLKALSRAGWPLIATSSHKGTDLYQTALPRHCIFAVGNEVTGMSRQRLSQADLTIRIPGTGAIESLNVSACTSILLSEHWRQHRGQS